MGEGHSLMTAFKHRLMLRDKPKHGDENLHNEALEELKKTQVCNPILGSRDRKIQSSKTSSAT